MVINAIAQNEHRLALSTPGPDVLVTLLAKAMAQIRTR
jgi:hypothetical protein